ncbi:hypothetical protein JCM10450v2_003300 [Rhodotorula kratochvilovae]
MVPYIPFELVDLISSFALADEDKSDNARRDRKRLAGSFARVCRAWYPIGRAYLWRTVRLQPGRVDVPSSAGRTRSVFSYTRELEVVCDESSVKMDKMVARCRRDSAVLERVVLKGAGAWDAWFDAAPRARPLHSILALEIGVEPLFWNWLQRFKSILASATKFPALEELHLRLDASTVCRIPRSWPVVSKYATVTSLTLESRFSSRQELPFLQAIPRLVHLHHLTSLDLLWHGDLSAIIHIVQQAPALCRLALRCPRRPVRDVATALQPFLPTMRSLKTLVLVVGSGSGPHGGLFSSPGAFLQALPPSLREVDVDCHFKVSPGAPSVLLDFLDSRISGPLVRWTSMVCVPYTVAQYARETWIKTGGEGETTWVRE